MENENKSNDYEQLKRDIIDFKIVVKSDMKAINDKIQDVREMREAETMVSWFSEISENIEKYKEDLAKAKNSIDQIMNDISIDELNKLKERSGVTLKEIALYLGYDPVNLSCVSNLMSGKTKDPSKRLLAYNFMLMQLNKTTIAS